MTRPCMITAYSEYWIALTLKLPIFSPASFLFFFCFPFFKFQFQNVTKNLRQTFLENVMIFSVQDGLVWTCVQLRCACRMQQDNFNLGITLAFMN